MLETPCYIIREERLERQYTELNEAMQKHWPNYVIGYSVKTNGLPWVLTFMRQRGVFAEVVSDDERAIAMEMGFPQNEIIFNGPVKSKAALFSALRNGSIVNIDSHRELRWLADVARSQPELFQKRGVGLRINFDIEKMCPGESACADSGGRFGFCYENGEFERALMDLRGSGIPVTGLHLHNSSKTRSRNIYRAIADMACRVIRQYDLNLDYIDVGGGFFGGVPGKPNFREYLGDICERISAVTTAKDTALIVEPGISLIGASADYLTTVTDVKKTPYGVFAVTDGSRTHIDPLFAKTSYLYEIIHSAENEGISPVTGKGIVVCGFTCMENDRLMCINREVSLYENDQILYYKTGAYTMCLSPQFIMTYPAVYVQRGEDYICVRHKNTANDYVKCHSI